MSVDNQTRIPMRALAALLAVALTALLLPVAASAAKHRQRPLYWGAWIGTQLTGTQPPWDMSAVSQFAQMTRKRPSLIEFAAPFENCHTSPCAYYPFPTTAMEAVRNYGAIPVYSWSSASSSSEVEDPAFQLSTIVAGTYDSYIREFAEAARNWGHPFFLRFDWEMNGNWFPWSEGVNGNKSGEYVAAWRHVHDIFTAVGATNATWVWCPYADAKHKFPPMGRYYPGDAYVGWTCLDGYNWGKNAINSQHWNSFEGILSSSYRTLVRRIAPRKPMMLAELASGGGGRAKSIWIRGMFKALATKFRRIRGLVWFDQVDRGVQWPLESSPLAERAFAQGLHHYPYRTSSFGEIPGRPILPPR